MRSKEAAGKRQSSGRRNNDISWIYEIKDLSNVAIRKKRGRREPPPSKSLRGKKVDKVIDSDGPSSASEEQEKETYATRSREEGTLHLKQKGVDSEATSHNDLAKEDGSGVQAAVKKGTDEKRSSRDIKDIVSNAQVDATSSEDNSAEEVEDVKVCDICGDVGDEEKLAVCSRCNDGAEHTYCMRVMMEEAPESEWLCEECQTEVEFEKENKLEKCQVNVGTSKGQSIEGKMNKPVTAANGRSSMDSEIEAENVGNKESGSVNEGNDIVNNRMEEDATVVRETIPESSGLYMGADSRRRLSPSRESSFKFDLDKGKQPNHHVATSLASNAPKNLAPEPRGQLSKSTSFNNSKVPKVKQLLNELPQTPKSLKEAWSSTLKKEAPISMTTKSATFKKPKSFEQANKAKSSIFSPAEETRMNPLVSRNVTNDRGTSILGCPSATSSMVATVPSKADTTVQHLATENNMTDSNNLSIAQGQGGKNSHGNSEIKKPLLANMPGSTMLPTAERSSGILGSGAQRKVIQNSDPLHRDNKIKDAPSFRPGASSSNRLIRCQRCNEAGHSTQFCAVDKLRLSAMKPLSDRNLKDASANRTKTPETSSLVATEKAASRLADQSEQSLKCGTYQNPIYGPKDVLSTSFSHVKKPAPLFARTNEQHMSYRLSERGSAASIDCSKLKFRDDYPTQSAMAGRCADNGNAMPSDLRDESSQGFSTVDEPLTSTMPELDYIWQGGFELWRTGRSPELCDGFQAHLSCSASQLVLEVAKKFPSKVQLEELPRENSWPTQFQESGPMYDNVGLFFFARDAQSYESHYSKLVENMLKNDLVLRGSVDTVELLIFPSNILSKNIQRWNMFYFLWGVFIVSRKNCIKLPPDVHTSRRESNVSEGPRVVNPSISALPSYYSLSEGTNNFFEPDPNLVKLATCTDHQCVESFEANHQGCLNGENSLNQPVSQGPLDNHHDLATERYSSNNNGFIDHSVTSTERKRQKLDYSGQDKMRGNFDGNVSERDFDVNKVPIACSVSLIHEEEPGKESTTINLNNAKQLMDIDHDSTTEVNKGSLDPLSHASGGARKRDFEMVNGVDDIDIELEHKKIKLDNVVSANSGLSENTNDGRLSSKVHPLAASSVDDGTDNKVMSGSLKGGGKCVFPLDLNSVDDAVSENVVDILSSDDEELQEPGVLDPDIEKEDVRSSGKAMLSSVLSKVGEKQNKGDKLPTDITGPLSLSLAFPSRKAQASKPHLGPERQLPKSSSWDNA